MGESSDSPYRVSPPKPANKKEKDPDTLRGCLIFLLILATLAGAVQIAHSVGEGALRRQLLRMGEETTSVRAQKRRVGGLYVIHVGGGSYDCSVAENPCLHHGTDCEVHVAVLYDPADPSHCRPKSMVGQSVWGDLLMGAVFCAPGLLALVVWLRAGRDALRTTGV